MSKKPEGFRDRLYTVDEKGRRLWVYPKYDPGKIYFYRRIVAVVLIAIYFGTPWVKINNLPLFQIDLSEKSLFLLGKIFGPEDALLLSLLLLCFPVGLFLFTAVLGRVWCGWACPQTVFLEFIYRPVERFLEGNRPSQMKLDLESMNLKKFSLKLTKWILFFIFSWFVANSFLMYFWGTEKVLYMITHDPQYNLGSFIFSLSVIAFFIFNFGWFREQMCTLVCPYGRFQSVLLDSHSLVVTYDFNRGEPKTKLTQYRINSLGKGDCIDCGQCVQVCPTGIDIRNGLQLECIHCAACVDTCNKVMKHLGRKPGLIRYDNSLHQGLGAKSLMRTRVALYTVFFVLLTSVLAFQVLKPRDLDFEVIRGRGNSYEFVNKEEIQNVFSIKVYNPSNSLKKIRIIFKQEGQFLDSHTNVRVVLPINDVEIKTNAHLELPVIIEYPKNIINRLVQFQIIDKDKIYEKDIELLGPKP